MTTITFDTHAFGNRPTAAGMPEPQAETVTALVREAQDSSAGEMATKGDVSALRTELLLLEQRMTIKLGGLTVVASGLILAAIKFLH